MKSFKSFVKKSNFQSVFFAIICMTFKAHTYILFKSILNDVQTKDKGKIITA